MDSSASRDLGYRTQQFVSGRPKDAGSSFIMTPSGGLRIYFPSGGASQYVDTARDVSCDGRPETDYNAAAGSTTQVFRIGPRYNASLLSPNRDRRGSVDSGLAHVIQLGAGGPQVFRIRGAGSGQADHQPSRVIHLGPGAAGAGGGNATAPRHQVIRIGPQGVRVLPTGNDSPSARVYRVVPFDMSASYDGGRHGSPPVVITRNTADVSLNDYQQMTPPANANEGCQSPLRVSSSQPRLVSYTINSSPCQQSMTMSPTVAPSCGLRLQQRQDDWQCPGDHTDTDKSSAYSTDTGTSSGFRGRRRDSATEYTGQWPHQQHQQPYQQIEYQPRRVQAAPGLATTRRMVSGDSSAGSYPSRYGDDETVTPQVFELDGPRRFRVQISGGSGGGGPSSRRISASGQQQQPVADARMYTYATDGGATDDGTRSTATPADSGMTVTSGAEQHQRPVFTVRAVGQLGSDCRPITDFGELVCESIRQFLAYRQKQQQHQQQQQQPPQQQHVVAPSPTPSAVPWRVAREYQSSRPHSPQTGSTGTFDGGRGGSPNATPPGTATPEDRNLFQKYKFQFGSIGNFGRSNSRDDACNDNSGNGSWNTRQQQQPTTQSGPIAVFCFQDFDDMVAKMQETRDQVRTLGVGPQTTNYQDTQRDNEDSWRQQQQQLAERQASMTDHRQPKSNSLDNEDDGEDSGYHTGSSQTTMLRRYDGCRRPAAAAATTVTRFRPHQMSREQLRNRIAAFNNNNQGFIISLDQQSDVYHGMIRLNMNLIRPVQMTLTSRPVSIYDAVNCEDQNSQEVDQQQVTTFHLPKDTTKVIHISSETTTKEVIRTLLSKFRIRDNPHKFALYEKFDGNGTTEMRRLEDCELPLPLCLSWITHGVDFLERYSFVLQENDTGEILWEAFSLPELENFLMILNKEEEEYLKQITQTYRLLNIHFHRRLKELRRDRIGPGAKLQQQLHASSSS